MKIYGIQEMNEGLMRDYLYKNEEDAQIVVDSLNLATKNYKKHFSSKEIYFIIELEVKETL